MQYTKLNIFVISIGFAVYLFDRYNKDKIKDEGQMMMCAIAAFVYLWAIERIW